jgi:acetoin utilization protein AcuB
MSRVANIMTSQPATIRASATAGDAAREMQRLGLRHLPVVDEQGRLVGILSDRDLRGPMVGIEEAAPTIATPIAQLMTLDVVTARPDDEVGVVARRIVDRRIGAVPIVDDSRAPIGIISYVDVLRKLADEADEDARAIELMDR